MSVAVQQPLDFAPVELRAHGLRDAHSFPLVGSRTAEGVRSWRMPASPQTWGYPSSSGVGLAIATRRSDLTVTRVKRSS